MIKKDLVKEIANKTGVKPKIVELVIDAFLYSIKKHVLQYEPIFLRKFGKFFLKKRSRRKAQNMKKKKAMIIPEHYIFHFQPAIKLSDKSKKIPIKDDIIKTEDRQIIEDDGDLQKFDPTSLNFAPTPPPPDKPPKEPEL